MLAAMLERPTVFRDKCETQFDRWIVYKNGYLFEDEAIKRKFSNISPVKFLLIYFLNIIMANVHLSYQHAIFIYIYLVIYICLKAYILANIYYIFFSRHI